MIPFDFTGLFGQLAGPVASPAGHRFDFNRETWISLFISNMSMSPPWNETHFIVVAVKEKDVQHLHDEPASVHMLLVEKAAFYPQREVGNDNDQPATLDQ